MKTKKAEPGNKTLDNPPTHIITTPILYTVHCACGKINRYQINVNQALCLHAPEVNNLPINLKINIKGV